MDLSLNEVEEIREEGTVPSEIKKMSIRQKRYDKHAVLLLHFRKGSIQLATLQTIRSLFHCRVSWKYFTKKAGPMHCRKCQLYGHGKLCAEQHDSFACPLKAGLSNGDGRIPEQKLKSANCEVHHTASCIGCPKRPVPIATWVRSRNWRPHSPASRKSATS